MHRRPNAEVLLARAPDERDTGPFAGSDVDLHVMHPDAPSSPGASDRDGDGRPDPYFDQPYDCYWGNPQPDWGTPGDDGDPGLDRDDTDGAGPEIVNLRQPEEGAAYRIAVHYGSDHGYGASLATVRLYVGGELVEEIASVGLDEYDLWCVGAVHWPSGRFVPCEVAGGRYAITPGYQP